MNWFSIGFIFMPHIKYLWAGINCYLIPFHTDHVSIWRSNFLYKCANFYPYFFASQQRKLSFIFNVYSYHFHCTRDQRETVTNTLHYSKNMIVFSSSVFCHLHSVKLFQDIAYYILNITKLVDVYGLTNKTFLDYFKSFWISCALTIKTFN